MSDELLYNAVKSGRVKIGDLNDDGRKALYNFMDQKTSFTQKNDQAQMDEFQHQQPFEYTPPAKSDRQVIDEINAADNPLLQGNKPTFTENPIGYIVDKAPRLFGLPEGSLNKLSAAIDAPLTPNAPYIKSTGLFSADPVAGPTPYEDMVNRRDHLGPDGKMGKGINIAGDMLSYVAPLPGMNPILSEAYNNGLTQKAGQWAGNLVENKLGSKILQHGAQGATAGALYGATQPFVQGNGNLSDMPKSMLENAVMFGLGDAALPLVGAGLKATGEGLNKAGLATKDLLAGEPAGMRSAVNDFVTKVDQSLPQTQAGRLVKNVEMGNSAQSRAWADNFNRYDTQQRAMDSQYNFPSSGTAVDSYQKKIQPPDPTNLDELLKVRGFNDATPENIAQVYNGKTWYHGTGTDKLTADNLDPFVGSHESLFGQGIYLTDNPKIAEGYAKSRGGRTRTPTIYDANVNVNRVLDLEKPVTPDVYNTIQKTVKPLDHSYAYYIDDGDKNYFSNLIEKWSKEPGATPEQIITKLRKEVSEFSHEAELSTNDFVENFQDLATNLKEVGYDGITHTGGHRTGNNPHRVLIMLDPKGTYSNLDHPNQITRFDKYGTSAQQTTKLTDSQLPINKNHDLNWSKQIDQPRNNPHSSTPVQSGVQDYAGNQIPFRQAATQTERIINRNQVVNNMRNNLGVTIDTGRLVSPGRGTLGQFKVNPEVIRTRMAEDLQVISHEVGHNLDKRYNLQDPAYQHELINLTNTVNPNHLGNYNPAKHYDEAIAEYFRTRLTDPQRAQQLAPNFSKFLESKLSPKDLKGLEASAKDIDTWISQGDYNQAKGLIDFTSGEKKEGFNFNKFYSRFVDDLDPLRLAEKALKGAVGIGKDSIYKMARLSRGISQRAELAVKRGIYVNGQKVSDGLTEIVKPLESIGMKEKDFATYLAVKHAEDLKAMGKRVPFDDAQMKAVMQKWGNNPEVQQVHQKIMEYNHALLGILEEAQILSSKAIQEMKQKYPNYVPFMRYFDDDAIAGFKNGGFGAAKGFANITNPIKKMSEEGSTRTIINPIESMVKNTFLVMNAAAKNKVGLQLSELAKIDGAGSWVEAVGKGGASPHEHIISVFENGERQALKIRNPELHSAMLSLDTESSNSLIRFLGGAASILRAGATLTPDFMIRNALRDIVGNTVNSTKYGFNPLTIFNGLYHMVNRKTGVFDQFLSSGGAMGTLMSLDREANREALKAVFRTSIADKAMNVVTSPKELIKMFTGVTPLQKTIGILRKGSEVSELSTRLGAFNKVLKKTGSPEEAAYQARDLMDFNRAGSAIRPANKAVAFMNANIQGMDRMRRAFMDNPASFLVRAGTTLVLPAASVYLWNKYKLSDEEKKLYDNIPQWQKDSFFVVGIPGTGKFLRIPKPFEAGMLFGTGTERVLRLMEDHDPEAFKGYASSLVQTLTPPMMITALTPMLEAMTNYSFFRNAPLVPQSEQKLEKKDQYGLFTSETSKLIGSVLGQTPLKDSNAASPRIIDNTIKGYTAGLGQYAISGLDSIIRAANGKNEVPQPAKSLTERAPISSFMASTSGGGQIRQDFYDKWDELSKAEASAKKNGEAYADPQYFVMKQSKAAMDQIMKAYKLIQNSPTISSNEKRAKLDDLDKFMNEIAGQGLGKK